jgi:uncharacterized protein YceH (UPF0502 family)
VFDQPDAGIAASATSPSASSTTAASQAASTRRDLEDRITALEQNVGHLISLLGELPPTV